MGASRMAAINELVCLVESFDPERLKNLQNAYPDLLSELQLGIVGGVRDEASSTLERKAEVVSESIIPLAVSGIEARRVALEKLALAKLDFLTSRITRASRMKILAHFVAIIGSSSAVSLIDLEQMRAAQLSNVLVLVSSLAGVYADKLLNLNGATKDSIVSLHEQGSVLLAEVESCLVGLQGELVASRDIEKLSNSIEALNTLAKSINVWSRKVNLISAEATSS